MATNPIGLAVSLKLKQGHASQGVSVISSTVTTASRGTGGTACSSFLSSCSIKKQIFAGLST